MTIFPAEGPSRLLVVDDNEMNRDMLSRRLQKQGHEVQMAAGGAEALAMMAASVFDLVLLDLMMPEMDGFQVLERLKGDEALRHIPVVMISAASETEGVVRCIELGAEDYLPKPFNPVILKARVNACLEKKRFRDRERLYAASMERELEIGRQIQAGFFPETLPSPAGWSIAARFRPAKQVAGDFYDAFSLRGGRMALIVADVCDKGVGAALYMALFRSLLRAFTEDAAAEVTGADVLSRSVRMTNDYIARTHGRANMFATIFIALLDPASGELIYINGGHEPPLILSAGVVRNRLNPTGPAVGMLEGMVFSPASEVLAEGETLVAFTDGVTEARGESGLFSAERLESLLACSSGDLESLLGMIDRSLDQHVTGYEQSDDITILAVKRE